MRDAWDYMPVEPVDSTKYVAESEAPHCAPRGYWRGDMVDDS